MNEELSAYTFDVDKKISLNGIGSVGFKDQLICSGAWVSKTDETKSQRSVGFQNSDQKNWKIPKEIISALHFFSEMQE